MDEIGGISSDGRRLCYIIELFIPLILKRRMNIDIIIMLSYRCFFFIIIFIHEANYHSSNSFVVNISGEFVSNE